MRRFLLSAPVLVVGVAVCIFIGRAYLIEHRFHAPVASDLENAILSPDGSSTEGLNTGGSASTLGANKAVMGDDKIRDGERETGNGPISQGQTWTIKELLAINRISDEIFFGNSIQTIDQTYPPVEKSFVFPDGNAITIPYDRTRPPAEPIEGLDDGVSAGFFDRLRESADQGNATATRELYRSLVTCRRLYPTSDGELAQAKSLLRDGTVVIPDVVNVEEYIGEIENGYRRCSGTSDDMLNRAIELLALSAEAGDTENTMLFVHEVYDSNSDLAEEFATRLWRDGYMSGLSTLAQLYSDHINPTYDEAVRAFGHAYASNILRIVELDGSPVEPIIEHRERFLYALEGLESSTSYSIVQDGIALAKELITQNENCCR